MLPVARIWIETADCRGISSEIRNWGQILTFNIRLTNGSKLDVSFFATSFALVPAVCATAAGCTARCPIAGYFVVSLFTHFAPFGP